MRHHSFLPLVPALNSECRSVPCGLSVWIRQFKTPFDSYTKVIVLFKVRGNSRFKLPVSCPHVFTKCKLVDVKWKCVDCRVNCNHEICHGVNTCSPPQNHVGI